MSEKALVIPASKLSAETLIALFDEANVTAERGPEEMGSVVIDMGGVPFLIDAYPQHGSVKIWTAQEIDHEIVPFDRAALSANSFNQAFLFVRNFVFQDPEDPSNYRAIWDHDHLVTEDGLTSKELMAVLVKVSDVIHEALSRLYAEEGPAN